MTFFYISGAFAYLQYVIGVLYFFGLGTDDWEWRWATLVIPAFCWYWFLLGILWVAG
jgi:heme/copper-type cytochrome/quinol oxidase subunit 4